MVKLTHSPTPAEIKKLCSEIRNNWTALEYQKRSAPRQLSVWVTGLNKWVYMAPDELHLLPVSANRLN